MKLDVTKLPVGEVLVVSLLAAVVVTFVLAFVFASGSGIGSGDVEEGAATDPAQRGQEVVQSWACTSCHSLGPGVLTGPSWPNLFGKTETLDDGTEVLVDGPYVRESILDPSAKVVQGFFDGIMPSYPTISDEDIQDIIAFMQSLSEEQEAEGTPAAEQPSEETLAD
jgi:cytochrome c2